MNFTSKDFAYNGTTGTDGTAQIFTVPVTGTYKLEAWGAEGATDYGLTTAGQGGYSYGNVYITAGQQL